MLDAYMCSLYHPLMWAWLPDLTLFNCLLFICVKGQMSLQRQIVPIASFTSERINPFTSPIFQKATTNLAPCQAYRLYNTVGFSSLWYVENLAWHSDNKGTSFCLTKHGSINLQGKHVCYQRQPAFPPTLGLQLMLNIWGCQFYNFIRSVCGYGLQLRVWPVVMIHLSFISTIWLHVGYVGVWSALINAK